MIGIILDISGRYLSLLLPPFSAFTDSDSGWVSTTLAAGRSTIPQIPVAASMMSKIFNLSNSELVPNRAVTTTGIQAEALSLFL